MRFDRRANAGSTLLTRIPNYPSHQQSSSTPHLQEVAARQWLSPISREFYCLNRMLFNIMLVVESKVCNAAPRSRGRMRRVGIERKGNSETPSLTPSYEYYANQ
jgi:hypothetical protein